MPKSNFRGLPVKMSDNIRFCPNCGSTNVEFDTDHTNVIGEMIANQNKWLCNECGYRGLMPEGNPEEYEEDIENEEITFEPEEQETVDANLGTAYFKYFMYISLPITVLYILFRLLF